MKKKLFLTALIALSTSVVSANVTDLDVNSLFDQPHEFGYTVNQNINVVGFDEGENTRFLIKTPIIKDAKDIAVGEYHIILGDKPMSNYISSDAASLLREDLIGLPVYETSDIEGELDLEITDKNAIELDKTYYGIVVPVDDNVNNGDYSKQFCFNLEAKLFAEGDACTTFKVEKPEPVKEPEPVNEPELTNNPEPMNEQGPENEPEQYDEEIDHNAAGADMRLADISHSVQGNTVTLTWTAVPNSENVEIKLFDKASADYVTLGTVPMAQENFQYQYKESDEELLFAFIPRDAKGKEIRYDVNVRYEPDPQTPEIKITTPTGPAENIMIMVFITLALYAGYRMTRKAE